MANTRQIDEAEHALDIDSLTYSFKDHKAIDDLSFRVGKGAIHGFVGPNGAGKTTTLKIASTLLMPKANRVKVFGMDVTKQQKKVRTHVGFMPDTFAMYRPMKVFEYLDFFAAAYGQPTDVRDQTISDVLALTDMTGRRDHLIKSLSRGMQQRVCLARVLVHDPHLLLLDEPASGLDPRARIELMDILRELRSIGKTIFISSHILAELATLCDEVTIIDRGAVKYTGSMQQLLNTTSAGDVEYVLTLRNDPAGMKTCLEALDGVRSCEREENSGQPTYRVLYDSHEPDTGPLLRAVLDRGGLVVGVSPVERQLDEAFMDLTEPGLRE